MFTGHRRCGVVGGSKYGQYAFVPSALHLRHPVNIYRQRGGMAENQF